MARAYSKNCEATRRAFIDPPSWLRYIVIVEDGLTPFLYRAGDSGRQNSDGSLHLDSRIDSQVKVAGRRIELAEEIEHYISTYPNIRLFMVP